MQLTYDAEHGIAYLRFGAPGGDVDTIRVSDSVLVDLNPDGSVFGIELLDANRQLAGGDASSFTVEAGDSKVTLPLVAAE